MSGTIDAIFEQHERNEKKKRDRLKTPDGGTVTSPVEKPAAKANKAAESSGSNEEASGTARRTIPFAEYRIARVAAPAATSNAKDQQPDPADEHSDLSAVLMDDSATFGLLEGREDDHSIDLDEAHRKDPIPDGKHARFWSCVVAASPLFWWLTALHIAAAPGAHEHGMLMGIGGIAIALRHKKEKYLRIGGSHR